MFCNRCGTKNPDTSAYCSKCGEKLNITLDEQAPIKSPKKSKTGLLVGVIAGGVAVIAAAIVLVLILTGAARSVTGDWYNKEFGEVFTFRADGTVIVTTAYGQVTGSYKFDPGTGKGVINVDNKDIVFIVEGGALVLSGDGGENVAFDQVEDAAEIAGIFPVPSSEFTPPPGVTEPPAVTPPAAVSTPESTSASTEHPPTVTPAVPTPTPVVLPPPATPPPSVTLGPPPTPPPTPSPTIDIFFPIIVFDNTDVLGSWRYIEPSGTKWFFTFNEDNTYDLVSGSTSYNGTYFYNSTTLSGTLTTSYGVTFNFFVAPDKESFYIDEGTAGMQYYYRY